jgi:uncharacterized protein YqeY
MAGLKQRINEDVKTAMRAREKARLGVLRLILAAIKQKEVDERIDLDDIQVMAVLEKLSKQHRDSIEQFQKAGRVDLVEKESFELDLVRSYLPQQISEGELESLVAAAIGEAGAASARDIGKVMALLKPKVQGRADMGKVSALVKAKLA